jgi:hypothetical protein
LINANAIYPHRLHFLIGIGDLVRRAENDAPIRDRRDFAIMLAFPAPGHDPVFLTRAMDAGRDVVAKIVRGYRSSEMMAVPAMRIEEALEVFIAVSC